MVFLSGRVDLVVLETPASGLYSRVVSASTRGNTRRSVFQNVRASLETRRDAGLRLALPWAVSMRRRREDEAAIRRSPSWPRLRTGRSRPSVVPRSRHESRRRRSSPTGSPSNSERSRSRGAPRPRSRRRRLCERASRRNDVFAAARRRAASRPDRRGCNRCVGGRDRAERAQLRHLRERFHAALGPTDARARRQRRGDADEDVLRLADRARRHRATSPRERALLRGVAAQSPPACSCRSGRSTRAGT